VKVFCQPRIIISILMETTSQANSTPSLPDRLPSFFDAGTSIASGHASKQYFQRSEMI
jgi:hypothetical protein